MEKEATCQQTFWISRLVSDCIEVPLFFVGRGVKGTVEAEGVAMIGILGLNH